MANILYQPKINPTKFVSIEPAAIPQYVSKHMDDWLFKNTIRNYEQPVKYFDKWLMDDSIRNQFTSNFSPLTLKLFSCDGTQIYSQPLETKQQNFFFPGYYIRQAELDIASLSLEEGLYYFTIPEAGLISEPFEIVEEAENTTYIEATNSFYYEGVNYDVSFSPAYRLPSILRYKQPASVDTVYQDQNESETMLHSVPYRIWQFILGGEGGVPPYLIDKVSRIFGCDSLKIDGREYTKAEGAQWELNELENYPMAGWSIDLREKLNRNSLIYENEVQLLGKAIMMSVSDTKGFGLDDNGNDFLEIEDVE